MWMAFWQAPVYLISIVTIWMYLRSPIWCMFHVWEVSRSWLSASSSLDFLHFVHPRLFQTPPIRVFVRRKSVVNDHWMIIWLLTLFHREVLNLIPWWCDFWDNLNWTNDLHQFCFVLFCCVVFRLFALFTPASYLGLVVFTPLNLSKIFDFFERRMVELNEISNNIRL
jgi:hypothetical protein